MTRDMLYAVLFNLGSLATESFKAENFKTRPPDPRSWGVSSSLKTVARSVARRWQCTFLKADLAVLLELSCEQHALQCSLNFLVEAYLQCF